VPCGALGACRPKAWMDFSPGRRADRATLSTGRRYCHCECWP